MLKNVVGLFGTCGSSKWREEVAIPILDEAGIEYFNPVVADWNYEAMKNEADHAATDKVVLLVITGETTGIASMAESGWIALQSQLRNQNLVMVLEDMPPDDDDLRINKTRKLIRQHISHLPEDAPVYLYDTIEAGTHKAVELMK